MTDKEQINATINAQFAILPLAKVLVSKDWGPRERLTDIGPLAQSMIETGQVEPAIVRPIPGTDTYALLEGTRRHAALKKAGIATIKCQIVPEGMTDTDARWLNVVTNTHRAGYTGYETAKALADFAEKAGLPAKGRGAEIARRFGLREDGDGLVMSASYVNNMLRAFEKLIPDALKAWAQSAFADDMAWHLAAMTKEEQEEWLPRAKRMSLAQLKETMELAASGGDGEGEGEGEGGGSDKGKGKGKGKPGKAALKKALAFATEQESEDAIAVLRWALGIRATLTLGGVKFDPKAKAGDNAESDE